MKFIHLHQPWASLVAWGYKTSLAMPFAPGRRGPSYEGWVALCATKEMPAEGKALCKCQPAVARALRARGYSPDDPEVLPTGGLVGVAWLSRWVRPGDDKVLEKDNRMYPDPWPGPWLWVFAASKGLDHAVPCRWRPSWNDVPDETLGRLVQDLGGLPDPPEPATTPGPVVATRAALRLA